MMWSFILSLTVVLLLTSHVHATCESTIAAKCNTQLGLNTSRPIEDCYQAAPDGCTNIALQGCNSTLPASSSYIVLCTAAGLKFYSSNNSSGNQCALNTSLTSALCSGHLFNCSEGQFLTASATTAIFLRMNNCSKSSTTAAPGLQLIPNPVGPDAITAIVVIICLVITGILAGFFFWPKCHIADPAAHALKKVTKPSAAKAASSAAGATGGSSSHVKQPDNGARVVYEPDRKTAHIKLPSVPGPSAA